MRRRVVQLGGCLLLGAAVNVAVAWIATLQDGRIRTISWS